MKSYLVIVFAFVTFNLFAQNNESIVAQIGNDKITAREFKLRLELAPYIPKDQNMSKDSIKYDLLYSLIAEKIWALKAKEEGIENTQEFNFFFKPIEDLFVRDALFKQEIDNKISITAPEMEKGIYKSQFTQVIRFFSSTDSTSIFKLHKQLDKTSNLDSLINLFTSIEDTIINVKFGDLGSEAIEDTIYSLKKGSYSTLQKTNGGYLIYYCVDNVFTPLNLGDQQIVEGINNTIRGRKLEILYNDYRNDLLTGTNIKINPKTILLLSNSIWKKLKLKSPATENEQTYFELSEKDFQDILTSFTDKELKLPLFNLKNKTIKLYDFLSRTAYMGFSIPQLDSNLVVSKLAFTSKLFVEEQILTEEGYKKAYNLLPSVQNDLKIWKQKYLAQMYMISQLESIKVTDEQLRDYYYTVFNKYKIQIFVKTENHYTK